MSRVFSTVLSLTAVATIGYCVYFDYARRHNPDFRKNLKKKSIKAAQQKKQAVEQEKTKKLEFLKEKLNESLEVSPLPTSMAEKEAHFMTSVAEGEKISVIPGKEVDAAISFYRALAVYPEPSSILEIYQRTIPPHIYELVMMLTAIQPPIVVASMLGDSLQDITTD